MSRVRQLTILRPTESNAPKRRAVAPFATFLVLGLFAAVLTLNCTRPPDLLEIPAGYRGWIQIYYGYPQCPPLPQKDGGYFLCDQIRRLVLHIDPISFWAGPGSLLLRRSGR